tara:strand:+ start:50 stop:310 length:261 start_codon:yes stop_codon:yes gene_type:complete
MSERLLKLKTSIEDMTKYHQIEILRILYNLNEKCINENNNGSFINLTEQSEYIISELEKYTVYVKEQQEQLNKIEDEKNIIKETFF